MIDACSRRKEILSEVVTDVKKKTLKTVKKRTGSRSQLQKSGRRLKRWNALGYMPTPRLKEPDKSKL